MEHEGSLLRSHEPTLYKSLTLSLCAIINDSVSSYFFDQGNNTNTRDVCKVYGLAAVCRCYAEGGGDCYAKF
jgi:hypothetical protein